MRTSRVLKRAVMAAVLSGLGLEAGAADEAARKPAVPVDAIQLVLDAFRSHPFVALSEGEHWNEQGFAFRLALLRDPRFAATVNDIVVESGSVRYQPQMDRFIAGGFVPYETLRQVWESSTMPNTVWDMPIYEEFFRAVRDLNRSRPAARRLRVLLADPYVDWTKIANKDDVLRLWDQRASSAAGVVLKEVLAKHRRALLVFGDGHLFRSGPDPTVVGLIEKAAPGTVFNIAGPTWTDLAATQPDVAGWRAPAIAMLSGTKLGTLPFGEVYKRMRFDGALDKEEWRALPLEREFDAILYLGPPSSITRSSLAKARCADAAYLKMRLARMALMPWGHYEIDALNQFCGLAPHA